MAKVDIIRVPVGCIRDDAMFRWGKLIYRRIAKTPYGVCATNGKGTTCFISSTAMVLTFARYFNGEYNGVH